MFRPRTGDLVLCVGWSWTSAALQALTREPWTHVGIAVRLIDAVTVSLDDEGDLYLLDCDRLIRFNHLSGVRASGVALVPWSIVCERYGTIVIRPLLEPLRTSTLARLTLLFLRDFNGIPFTNDWIRLARAWLSLSLESKGNHFFCSELVMWYYDYCLASVYPSVAALPYRGSVTVLGKSISSDTILPAYYSARSSPLSAVLSPRQYVYRQQYHFGYGALLALLLIVIVFVVVIRQ